MSGGKWSTYRKMAEDLTDKMIQVGKFVPIRACETYNYNSSEKVDIQKTCI